MKETISIILPAWNEEKTILITLKFLKKLKTPFSYSELILIAGGEDNTIKICESFKFDNFNNVIILEQEPGDFKSGALIKGIKKSKGEKIILMDADIIPYHNLAVEVVKALEKFDVVNCDFIPMLKKGFWYDYFSIFKQNWAKNPNNLSSLIGGSTISFRRHLIEEIEVETLFSDKTSAGVDYYMGQEFKKRSKRMGLVKKTKVFMPRPNNLKDFTRDRLRWIKAFFILYSNNKKFILTNLFLSSLYCIFPPLLILLALRNTIRLSDLRTSKWRALYIYFFIEYLLNLLRIVVIIGYMTKSLKPIGHFKGTDRYLSLV